MALAFPKLSFNGVTFCCIPFRQLSLYVRLFFCWTSEGGTAKTNAFCFAVGPVFAVAVDLVGKDGLWIVAKPLFISFGGCL